MTSTLAPVCESPPLDIPVIRTLQLGMGWLPEQPGNGLDRVYHSLMQHFSDAGVEATGLVTGSPSVPEDSGGAVRAPAPSTMTLPKRLWRFRTATLEVLDSRPIDLVASHFALYAAPAIPAFIDRPFVVHFHGPWAQESQMEGDSWWTTAAKTVIERLVYNRADRFIVLSQAFRNLLVQDYGLSPSRIRVVPGGVDVNRFNVAKSRDNARRSLGWPVDRPIVLSVRRLVRRVGLENLIAAMKEVRRQIPEALLLIAGSGELRNELEQRIDDADLKHHVRLLGFVPDEDLPTAYRAADVSVVPTVALEGFGLVAVESLAAGTPVLVTPIGGLPEIVRDLSSDLIMPDGEVSTLSAVLTKALSGSLRLPSDEDCRQYAQRHFSWSTVARRVRAVYEDLL